jgi:hypothetical protein
VWLQSLATNSAPVTPRNEEYRRPHDKFFEHLAAKLGVRLPAPRRGFGSPLPPTPTHSYVDLPIGPHRKRGLAFAVDWRVNRLDCLFYDNSELPLKPPNLHRKFDDVLLDADVERFIDQEVHPSIARW